MADQPKTLEVLERLRSELAAVRKNNERLATNGVTAIDPGAASEIETEIRNLEIEIADIRKRLS